MRFPPLPEPAAYLTEHDQGSMLWLDAAEAATYCAEGEQPERLVRASKLHARDAEVWQLALKCAAEAVRAETDSRWDMRQVATTGALLSAIQSLPLPQEGE